MIILIKKKDTKIKRNLKTYLVTPKLSKVLKSDIETKVFQLLKTIIKKMAKKSQIGAKIKIDYPLHLVK